MLREKVSCIYKIENITNNKCYVGQTIDYYKRMLKHKSSLNKNQSSCRKLQNTWNKYGEDKFTFEILEECPLDQLNQREIFWIQALDSINNGYNLEKGGREGKDFSHFKKGVNMIDSQNNQIIQSFNSAAEAQIFLNKGKNKIFEVCKGTRRLWAGYKWLYI